jgi:hypothetical protein
MLGVGLLWVGGDGKGVGGESETARRFVLM